jgi:glycolate oxidase iron-sulfur subunit
MADRLADRKISHIRDSGASVVLSGNAGCTLQIQAALRDAGLDIPVVHPMEVLDWSYRGVTPKEPRTK